MALSPASGPTAEPPVAVFDATWPPALAFTRALGRAGIPVHVYSDRPFPATRWSRYTTRFLRCPDPADVDRFQGWLRDELGAGRIDLVAPTSDLIVYHLAVAEPRPSLLARSLASPEQILSLVFKDRFEQTCEELGVPRPRTLAPSGPESLTEALDMRFPLVLKPRSHVGLGGVRGRLVRTKEELRSSFAPFDVHPGARSLLRAHPDLEWPLVQEFATDTRGGLFSIAGVVGAEGGQMLTVSRKWAQWPRNLGIGTLFEGVREPEVAARGAEVVRRFVQAGLFELELARDSHTGELVALDLNPRGYGQMDLAIAGGLNLPLAWYRAALGRPVESPADARVDELAWVHPLLFSIGRAVDPLRSRTEPGATVPSRVLRKRRVRAGTDWRDPLSSGAFLWWLGRQSIGIARTHLSPDE